MCGPKGFTNVTKETPEPLLKCQCGKPDGDGKTPTTPVTPGGGDGTTPTTPEKPDRKDGDFRCGTETD